MIDPLDFSASEKRTALLWCLLHGGTVSHAAVCQEFGSRMLYVGLRDNGLVECVGVANIVYTDGIRGVAYHVTPAGRALVLGEEK